jgi:hypothetical protein
MKDWITIKIKDKNFYLTPHFIQRYDEYGLSWQGFDLKVLNAVMINRPNYFKSLLKHNVKEAQYLYREGFLFVLERDYQTGDFRIFRTVYDARDKNWVNAYLSQTPKRKRTKFKETFK